MKPRPNPALLAIRAKARATVAIDGKPVVILNLNPYRPLYVVREWTPEREASSDYVETVKP